MVAQHQEAEKCSNFEVICLLVVLIYRSIKLRRILSAFGNLVPSYVIEFVLRIANLISASQDYDLQKKWTVSI